jgi:hypothetical protein
MKFKDYIENMNKLAEENPHILNMDVVYSEDDEGNNFNLVNYTPTTGHFDKDECSFSLEDEGSEINSVCIN